MALAISIQPDAACARSPVSAYAHDSPVRGARRPHVEQARLVLVRAGMWSTPGMATTGNSRRLLTLNVITVMASAPGLKSPARLRRCSRQAAPPQGQCAGVHRRVLTADDGHVGPGVPFAIVQAAEQSTIRGGFARDSIEGDELWCGLPGGVLCA
jgi:hypothetical protein